MRGITGDPCLRRVPPGSRVRAGSVRRTVLEPVLFGALCLSGPRGAHCVSEGRWIDSDLMTQG